jgi:hypothetical protein
MKLKYLAILPFASIAFSQVATAEQGYFGLNYAVLDYGIEAPVDFELSSLIFRGGSEINEVFSIEGRFGLGIGDDSIGSVNLELDNLFGFYGKVGPKINNSAQPYLLFGFSRVEGTLSAPGFGSETADDDDVSYGIGIDFTLSESISGNFEYMNYYDKDGEELSGISAGIMGKF